MLVCAILLAMQDTPESDQCVGVDVQLVGHSAVLPVVSMLPNAQEKSSIW